MKILSRTVILLSFISLFTDIASEMLYPVMPMFLASIGFSAALIGVLEGMAEAIAGLSKGYFGKLSDAMGRRVVFVRAGYIASALAKPLMAVWTVPLWVFCMRAVDRIGKGLRTGARDAVLSDEATPETKASVFGFHRSMDTAGAALGPILALLFLQFFPGRYALLFIISAIPGLVAVVFLSLLKERQLPKKTQQFGTSALNPFRFVTYWKKSPSAYRYLVAGLLTFALINSSDLFLLLMGKFRGFSDGDVIGAYIFYNLVYASVAFPLGRLADRVGLRVIFTAGLLLFAIVYAGVAFTQSRYAFFGLFFLYGIYAAATESVSKAWITNIAKPEDTATAIGFYTSFQSVCAFIASAAAGILWNVFSPQTVFLISSIGAMMLAFFFFFVFPLLGKDHTADNLT